MEKMAQTSETTPKTSVESKSKANRQLQHSICPRPPLICSCLSRVANMYSLKVNSGAILGVIGRDTVLKLSAAWGGLAKLKPLVVATLNWLNDTSPK